MDIVRGHKKMPSESGGIRATSNRLETSKFILNDLRDVGTTEKLIFLTDTARYAIGILEIVREIVDDDVDENLLVLALDSCGLVYIVINRCKEQLEANGELPDQLKVDVGGLTRDLSDIQMFVHKHVHRNFAKRLLKHGEDIQTILRYSSRLKSWMSGFLQMEDTTIHAVLDALVHQQWMRGNTKRSNSDTASTLRMDKISLTSIQPSVGVDILQRPLPLLKLPDPPPPPPIRSDSPRQPPMRGDSRDHLDTPPNHIPPVFPTPPCLSVMGHIRKESLSTPLLNVPEFYSRPQSICSDDESQASDTETLDPESRRKRRIERERARKMAERARWRKSEEEFDRLPYTNPEIENEGQVSSLPGDKSFKDSLAIVVQPESSTHQSPSLTTNRLKDHEQLLQDLESERLAAALHEKTQRDLAEEDERSAKMLVAALQRETEAEERKSKKKKAAKSDWRTDSSSNLGLPASPRPRYNRDRTQEDLDRGPLKP